MIPNWLQANHTTPKVRKPVFDWGFARRFLSLHISDALDARYHKLRDVCNEYADVMRAESLMKDQMPKKDNFVYDVNSWIAFCNLDGIGKKGFEGLMQRLQRGDNNNDSPIRQGLKNNFAGTHKRFKKALMVRHPMERILSVYR